MYAVVQAWTFRPSPSRGQSDRTLHRRQSAIPSARQLHPCSAQLQRHAWSLRPQAHDHARVELADAPNGAGASPPLRAFAASSSELGRRIPCCIMTSAELFSLLPSDNMKAAIARSARLIIPTTSPCAVSSSEGSQASDDDPSLNLCSVSAPRSPTGFSRSSASTMRAAHGNETPLLYSTVQNSQLLW